MEKCKFAFRKPGDASIHCELLTKYNASQCAHQYYCKRSRRWEASPQSNTCPIRVRELENSTKKEGNEDGIRKTAKRGHKVSS